MPRNQRAIRLDDNVETAIQAIANAEGRSFSDVLRRLLDEALTARTKDAARHM